ncbi:MAG: hypothetical protein JZU52_13285 [Lamprocystis purpurea]|jgi:hypothetical protein|uniref:hypothetical protein n=1 Tax=Lamprocystis purpurea TaxID=61598 RepID=UPI000372D04A|nr:hypothetical protein [Lamprocystis purpurea]MBV5274565.1 hypothetical protein [Lamprocystis purpurea]
MHRLILTTTILVLAPLLGGCGTTLPGHLGGIATYVSAEDYGELLCAKVDLESYPSCMSSVLDYFEEPHADDLPSGQSTSGPFAVSMDGTFYMGTYASQPFSGRFEVSSGKNACRGSFDAFAGSRDALYDVYCDDGRAGWADLILDQTGRNGIGQLTLNDGTKGEIIFGYLPLGRAAPYPFTNVWTPRPPGEPPF